MMNGAPAKTYDIFLSYSRADEKFVMPLHADLAQRGVRAFLDQKDIQPGELFEGKNCG
jgi:TIR domain-containing protein